MFVRPDCSRCSMLEKQQQKIKPKSASTCFTISHEQTKPSLKAIQHQSHNSMYAKEKRKQKKRKTTKRQLFQKWYSKIFSSKCIQKSSSNTR